ncbi:MAG: [FeFe] hydrogenase H-cluster radical SAM maturase HydG [Verrucomicrobiota bacterium]
MKTKLCTQPATFIDEAKIAETLAAARQSDPAKIREILVKARQLVGLDASEVAALMEIQDPVLLEEMFAAARHAKNEIYGNRLVLFAPLYISNLCQNECAYCAFRVHNRELVRRTLTREEIANETRILIDQGHKRVLMVAGESYPEGEGLRFILNAIETVYATRSGRGEIRRINVNIAPLALEEFKELKAAKIGTYQLFQETYHRATYAAVHTVGRKRDFDWRVTVFDRAMQAGIDDVGIGVLFGLYDWKFEMLAMQQHIRHMEDAFGVGPHTISVPRLEPAAGSTLACRPAHPVSDADFKKIVAILRLAVPYTGIIMSTRENADTRRATFKLGVSQISAGSRSDPGGYAGTGAARKAQQFQLGDHRSLDEVVRDTALLGYTPSFCTACYRLGRTGADFMDLAKPGLIKHHCAPNALSSCMEYLLDYAAPETRRVGEMLVEKELTTMENSVQQISRRLVGEVKADKRDVYV